MTSAVRCSGAPDTLTPWRSIPRSIDSAPNLIPIIHTRIHASKFILTMAEIFCVRLNDIRSGHLRFGRFARAAQRLQQYSSGKLSLHSSDVRRRQASFETGRNLCRLQLFSRGLADFALTEKPG